ncbi:Ankyrin repeat-containing protein [Brazilian cedratvirus IHUMI]|uniref:Ankyrin repeat-containing protein n=1 Tax=Brazilian cedratvirus IHUMI TaxID=2126980 RepID=A0A2R8FDC0_9VIRU|nr:Ankyrin repeat-containing protein [Brazilian cedratvirus IHUMI]
MQNTTIEKTLADIPLMEDFNVDERDEIIGELKTALEKIIHLSKRGYLFNDRAAALLAAKGELDLLEFCVEELGCPVSEEAFSRAAEAGHLECTKFLEKYKHNALDAIYRSVVAGHLDTLKYIVEQGGHIPDMDRLRFYQEKGGFPEVGRYLKSMFDM